MPKPDWANRVSNILLGGFGPEVVQGLIAGYFERISTEKCQQYIRENKNLTGNVSEKQWKLLREAARTTKIDLSYGAVIKEISSHRPDVLGIIATTDGGVAWLRRQVAEVEKQLTS